MSPRRFLDSTSHVVRDYAMSGILESRWGGVSDHAVPLWGRAACVADPEVQLEKAQEHGAGSIMTFQTCVRWTPAWLLALLILLSATPGHAEVTLESTQTIYEVGAVCQFTLRNDTPYVLDVAFPFYWVWSLDEDCLVDPCPEYDTGTVWHVPPWSEDAMSWSQGYGTLEFCLENACAGASLEQVPPGMYSFSVGYDWTEALTTHHGCVEAHFRIRDSSPTEGTTWARIKGLFDGEGHE